MRGVSVNGSNNKPLRGSKRTTLEGGIRVPFLVSWAGRIKPAVYDKPVIQMDLTATALKAAGLEAKPEWKLEGVDLQPYLSGDATGTPHDALYWRFGPQMAVRSGAFKLVRYDKTVDGAPGKPAVSAAKLYNLEDDIGETKDLSETMPDKVKELQTKWDAWNQSNVEPKWGGANTRENRTSRNASRPPSDRGSRQSSISIPFGSQSIFGSFMSSVPSVSSTMRATQRLRYHLRSAGTMYHGANSVEVWPITSL
jgi:hypothetical protein